MVSHFYKCIFIHIPKCAGTSIESALGHLDGHLGRGGQDHRPIRMIEKPSFSIHTLSSKENIMVFLRGIKHQKYNKVLNKRNKNLASKEQYRNYFKFTVVRNPWARAFSWYKNVMRDEMHQKDIGITSEFTLNLFLKDQIGKGMLRPQTYWLKNYKGEILFDYIGRFENLPDTFNAIKKNLILNQIEFPHKIKGTGEDYKSQYDGESIELIRNFYHDEIQLFEYTFDN